MATWPKAEAEQVLFERERPRNEVERPERCGRDEDKASEKNQKRQASGSSERWHLRWFLRGFKESSEQELAGIEAFGELAGRIALNPAEA